MRCVVVFLWIGFSSVVVGQEKAEPPKRDMEISADSTKQEADSSQQDATVPKAQTPEYQIIGKETPEVKEGAKTNVDEQRVFDVSIQPMTAGQREMYKVNLQGLKKPESSFEQQMKAFSGKLVVGYGSYTTPMFSGWVGATSGSADVLLRAGYESSVGLFPNEDFRNGFAGFAGGAFLPARTGLFSNGRFRGNIDFQGESYKLHGSLTPTRVRTLNRLNGDVWLKMEYTDGGFLTSAFHFNSASVVDSARSSENYAGFELTGGKSIDRTRLTAEMSLWRNFYASPTPKNDPYFSSLTLSAYYRPSDDVELSGGATLSVFRGSQSNARGAVYPILGFNWYVRKGLSVFGKYEPCVQRNTLSSFVEANPYLYNDVHIQHTEFFNNASVGTEIDVSKTKKARISANYKRARSYPIYVRTAENLWNITYTGTTRILSFEGTVYTDMSAYDDLAITFAFQNSSLRGALSGAAKEIPYFPHIILSTLYQHRFPFGMSFASSIKYTGRRFADLSNSRTQSSLIFWDASIEQKLFKRVSISIALENILDRQRSLWADYVVQPRRVILSVGLTW